VENMGLWDKLRNARNYVRERRGPNSYFRYKRQREDEREVAESGRERARDHAEHEREEAERGRDYEERYTADREREVTGKRPEREEETESDTGRS
jgi:hypothetical protein